MKTTDLTNRIYSYIPDDYHLKQSHENVRGHTSDKKELYETLDKRNARTDEYDTLKPLQPGKVDSSTKVGKVSLKECMLVIVVIVVFSMSVTCLALVFTLSNRVSSQLDHINTMEGHFKGEITKLYTEVNDSQGKYLKNQNIDRHVAFTAKGASGKNPMIFKETIQNYDNAYSETSGKFTCPSAGIYFFLSSLSVEDDLLVLSDLKCFLYVNNKEAIGTPVNVYFDNTYAATIVGTFYLETDDNVFVGCRNGDGFRRPNFSTFTGFLVALVE
ncbi:uncharacterized protein LOC132739922 [Ruditapes philippinarum]|uniref:uncharacterized protein LOC132739922 n=1 Tax=Ruditapes philippinarum TaxID=129788 RepID=UPI00295BAB8C|nr:uncharacterized protein LOC132739922 [Ruditapes philippinarum]